jgi:hypothetical protein
MPVQGFMLRSKVEVTFAIKVNPRKQVILAMRRLVISNSLRQSAWRRIMKDLCDDEYQSIFYYFPSHSYSNLTKKVHFCCADGSWAAIYIIS